MIVKTIFAKCDNLLPQGGQQMRQAAHHLLIKSINVKYDDVSRRHEKLFRFNS